MITKVTHVSVFVDNQDEAKDFYTNKLGLIVHTDSTMPNGFRWLTLCTKKDPQFKIALMPANTLDEKELVGAQGAQVPFLCFAVDNCQKTYEELKQKGVTFIDEPKKEVWGVSVSCKDLYGNILYFVESAK